MTTHRLFSTLVLAGVALTGCSGDAHQALASADAPMDDDAAATPDTAPAMPEDARSLADLGVDTSAPRMCDSGWPTTKGAYTVCTTAAGAIVVTPSTDVACTAYFGCHSHSGPPDPATLDLAACCSLPGRPAS